MNLIEELIRLRTEGADGLFETTIRELLLDLCVSDLACLDVLIK